jgi:hypothetical protein
VLGFARQPKVDYIDMHLYALKLNAEDMVARLASRIHKIRLARPNMRVTVGETWLYKHGAEEPKGMLSDAFFRDNFSFWSPLDEGFLDLLMGISRKENVAVVGPYFSQYFFAYFTFGDAESGKLPPWPGSVPSSWNKALESIRSHQFSPTGRAIRTVLLGCSRP